MWMKNILTGGKDKINYMSKSLVYNMDCMEAMRNMKDGEYDLAVVDPPYGHNEKRFGSKSSWFAKYKKINMTGEGWSNKYGADIIEWDVAPNE